MNARKCDRCGRYYDDPESNQFIKVISDEWKGASGYRLDLCHDCMKNLSHRRHPRVVARERVGEVIAVGKTHLECLYDRLGSLVGQWCPETGRVPERAFRIVGGLCSECGGFLHDEDRFCPRCGAQVVEGSA